MIPNIDELLVLATVINHNLQLRTIGQREVFFSVCYVCVCVCVCACVCVGLNYGYIVSGRGTGKCYCHGICKLQSTSLNIVFLFAEQVQDSKL